MWLNTHKPKEQQLLDQFFVTLNAIYSKIQLYSLPNNHTIISQIEDLFQSERNWGNAYHIEQLMINLFSQEELDIELAKRMIKAKIDLEPDVYDSYAHILGAIEQEAESIAVIATPETEVPHARNGTLSSFYAVDNGEEGAPAATAEIVIPASTRSQRTLLGEKKRILLSRLVEDLQWRDKLRHLHREYASQTRIRMSIFSIASLMAFYVPYWAWRLFSLEEEFKTYYILTALTAGWMGASFSMIISLKKIINQGHLTELEVIRRYPYILSRIIIGVGAAAILFYLLQTNFLQGLQPDFLQGNIFPTFTEPGIGAAATSSVSRLEKLCEKDLALFIIWCFIAGFSEKLVPTILDKAEAQVKR